MEGLTPNEIAANAVMFFVWIFILARITVQKKDDSEQMKTAKRFARSTLTATLIAAIVMGVLALCVTRS